MNKLPNRYWAQQPYLHKNTWNLVEVYLQGAFDSMEGINL